MTKHIQYIALFIILAVPSITHALPTSVARVTSSSLISTTPLSTTDKLDIDFRTGGDNLEPKDFQDNLEVQINLHGKSPIIVTNANKGQTWPNNSVRRVSIPLDGTIKLEDFQSITLKRKPSGGSTNNISATSGDNWNLDKITVTATLKVNGRNQRSIIMNQVSRGRGLAIFRFIYERRSGNTNPDEGTEWTSSFILPRTVSPTPTTRATNARITATINTGGDNLEGGRDNNVNLVIKFKSSTRIVTISNINNGANWSNWSENTVSKDIPSSTTLDISDIKSVEMRHTGGGGIFADNWHVDRILITIIKDGVSRVLVDRVGAPVHMFTGDTRSKTFIVGE